MIGYQVSELTPYKYAVTGRPCAKTQAPSAEASKAASFKEAFSGALQTTDSMEGIFREASEKYGVALNLLKAIGKAESNFNPAAVSSAGAQGVMQLMPSTARSLGVENSFDARSNIMGGSKYIAGLLEKYNGNTVLALSAYNAGSGNVDKYGGIPPFKETQNYVQKVLSYAGEDIDLSNLFDPGLSNLSSVQAVQGALPESGIDGFAGISFDRDDALYLAELMRLKLQGMFTPDEEEDSQNIL